MSLFNFIYVKVVKQYFIFFRNKNSVEVLSCAKKYKEI